MTDKANTKAAAVVERMKVADAAVYLGLAENTLNRMRCEGKGPRYMRLGNRIFYRRADLDAYLEACTVETTDSRAA
jgi:hypothetical protein